MSKLNAKELERKKKKKKLSMPNHIMPCDVPKILHKTTLCAIYRTMSNEKGA